MNNKRKKKTLSSNFRTENKEFKRGRFKKMSTIMQVSLLIRRAWASASSGREFNF
jgi:hypothetical protein